MKDVCEKVEGDPTTLIPGLLLFTHDRKIPSGTSLRSLKSENNRKVFPEKINFTKKREGGCGQL